MVFNLKFWATPKTCCTYVAGLHNERIPKMFRNRMATEGCRSVALSVNGDNGRLNACGFFAIDFCYDKLNNYDGRALNRKTCIDNWRMRLLMLAKEN